MVKLSVANKDKKQHFCILSWVPSLETFYNALFPNQVARLRKKSDYFYVVLAAPASNFFTMLCTYPVKKIKLLSQQ